MDRPGGQLNVLHGVFDRYLHWSQPFLHNLINRLSSCAHNAVLCNRSENLDRFPIPQVIPLPNRYLVDSTLALLTATYLKREVRPDVLHAHFGWAGLRVLLLKRFLRLPLVTTFGGKDVGVEMHQPLYDRLYRVLFDASDHIICVSQDLKRRLAAQGVERIEVIHRGTDLRRFRHLDRSGRSPSAPVRVLTVGRLVEKKGLRYLFEALAQLLREGLAVRLTVVGDGVDRPLLLDLRKQLGLEPQVEFAGAITHDGVREHMEQADILVHCSVTGTDGNCEGIPNAVVEAAATGLPIIGTRHGGIVEVVQDGKTGVLLEERDVPGLIAALRLLVTDRAARLALGRAGSDWMHADFDLDKQVARHAAIYQRLVAEFRQNTLWRRRGWIPDDFPEIMDQLFPWERKPAASLLEDKESLSKFSLSQFGKHWVGKQTFDKHVPLTRGAARANGRWLGRCYDLRRFVPAGLKHSLKYLLGTVLVPLVQFKHRREFGRVRQLDRQVLDYFRNGGDLEAIEHKLALPPDWPQRKIDWLRQQVAQAFEPAQALQEAA